MRGSLKIIGRATICAILLTTGCTTAALSGGKGEGKPRRTMGEPYAQRIAPLDFNSLKALASPTQVKPILNVHDFGARGDGRSDDTAAIQSAVEQFTGGGTLLFPAGTYLYSDNIRVDKPGVILWSDDAHVHATELNKQAFILQAPRTAMVGFYMTAEMQDRRAGEGFQRIILASDRVAAVNNRIDGSSAVGIFASGASNYVIAHNRVENTLADGIHNTLGSRYGWITDNVVRNTGDDMIAVVSYRRQGDESDINSDILIENNDVAGQIWGRGITVVGGRNITIRNNKISDTSRSAGILIAREEAYNTAGVENVLVENNTIAHVQTTGTTRNGGQRSGHPAIFVVSKGGGDDSLMTRDVVIRNNSVTDSLTAGLGAAGNVCRVLFQDNRLSQIRGQPIRIDALPNPGCVVSCEGNTIDGRPVTDPDCGHQPVSASGAGFR